MSEMEQITDELAQGHAGNPWHGSSRAAVLADVTAAEASWRASAGTHSIWELVLHMRGWTLEVARRAREGGPRQPDDGDWPVPPAPTEAEWNAARGSLDAAHEELARTLRTFDPRRLDESIGPERDAPLGTGVTYRRMFHGVAQHDAHHTGQIALLKRLVRGT
jgi:uncharacterized damage-inducible protein DinB